jgi:hypothetical protein
VTLASIVEAEGKGIDGFARGWSLETRAGARAVAWLSGHCATRQVDDGASNHRRIEHVPPPLGRLGKPAAARCFSLRARGGGSEVGHGARRWKRGP